MTSNMFSSFNPSTSTNFSINWMIMLIIPLIIPIKFWYSSNKSTQTSTYMFQLAKNNLMSSLTKNKEFSTILVSLFIFILMMNYMSLFPYIYPWTSMACVTMAMGMPMWTSLMVLKMKNPNKMMAHLIPPNTPNMLMPFMVMVETISILIQPITLSIRLAANITAGHIIMTLIAKAYLSLMGPLMIPIHITLSALELMVALIQSYVFVMLLSMYMK